MLSLKESYTWANLLLALICVVDHSHSDEESMTVGWEVRGNNLIMKCYQYIIDFNVNFCFECNMRRTELFLLSKLMTASWWSIPTLTCRLQATTKDLESV